MALTAAQLQTLKTNILANTAVIPAGLGGFAGSQVKDVPNTGDGNDVVAKWYNLAASPAYLVWNPATPIKSIRAAADLSKFTPIDAPPASTNTVTGTNDALLYQNRALQCQLKQANAVFILAGEGAVDATPQQFRQTMNDCLVNIPSGASGANNNAGWGTAAAPGAVRTAMQRAATNAEKVFGAQAAGSGAAGNDTATARGSATNPDALVWVGPISAADVGGALNLP